MPHLHLLVRSHFVDLPEASAERIADNAWTIAIPLTDAVTRRARRRPEPEAWEGAIFLIDDAETQPAVVTAIDAVEVCLTAWILD